LISSKKAGAQPRAQIDLTESEKIKRIQEEEDE